MKQKKYVKNTAYSQATLNKYVDSYRIAKITNDKKLLQASQENIFRFIRKWVYQFMWENYYFLMGNPAHRDDVMQDVWVCIFTQLEDYDYNKAALTTYLAPWIKHVIAEYCSTHFHKSSVYYSAAMRKVNSAINWCLNNGVEPTNDAIIRVTGLPESTVNVAIEKLIAKDYVSYELLEESGMEQRSHCLSPEAAVIQKDDAEHFAYFIQNNLSELERKVLAKLLDSNDPTRSKSSYREIAAAIGLTVPQVKLIISRITTTFKKSTELRSYHSLMSAYDASIDSSDIDVMDDDDFISEQMADLADFIDE